MIFECKVSANILHAETEDVDGKAFGQLLFEIPDNDGDYERVKKYLDDNKVVYSEI